jgi:hypothetical protein
VAERTNEASVLLTDRGLPRVGALLKTFGPSIASAVDGFVHTQVHRIVTGPRFARAWTQVNTVAHRTVVSALSGQGGGAVSVTNGQVTIDLAPFISIVRQDLAARGFTLVNNLPTVHPTLALFSSRELVKAQSAYRLINGLKIVLPILSLLPDLLGPDAAPLSLRFRGPDGTAYPTAHLILVSNDPYQLDHIGGMGTRERLDLGVLGIVTARIRDAAGARRFVMLEAAGQVSRYPGWQEWAAPRFEVDSGAPVEIGIDGEALLMDPPLVFESRPGALRVRLPRRAAAPSPAATALRLLRSPPARAANWPRRPAR